MSTYPDPDPEPEQAPLYSQRLDTLVPELTTFKDLEALLYSINNHGYRPTIRPHDDQHALLRTKLIALGVNVYPDATDKEKETNP